MTDEPQPAEVAALFAICKRHPDYQAFVRAMREDPEDDTTRLVFADWLQEQGFEEYAVRLRAFPMSHWHQATKTLSEAMLMMYRPIAEAAAAFADAMTLLLLPMADAAHVIHGLIQDAQEEQAP